MSYIPKETKEEYDQLCDVYGYTGVFDYLGGVLEYSKIREQTSFEEIGDEIRKQA